MRKLLVISALFFLLAPQVSFAALSTSLISYWKYDESSGNAADAVGSNTLTNTNTTAYTTGIVNNGANLASASSNYFEKTGSGAAGLSGLSDMSLSLWFKPAANVTVEEELVTVYSSGAGQRSYRFYADGAGNLNFQNSNDGTAATQATAAQALNSGTWYHLVVTNSSGTCTFYVNGSSIGSGACKTSEFNSTDPFRVGTRVAAGDFANGVIDELGIWSRALSSTEVTTLYNGGAACQYPFTVCEATAGTEDIGTFIRRLAIW